MLSEINKDRVRRARRWLAARIAPAGVTMHDPMTALCDCREGLLELVLFGPLKVDDVTGEVHGPVNYLLDEMWLLGAVEPDGAGSYQLTRWGERELARMWGPGIIPPWSGGYYACLVHGVYDAGPGDPSRCPDCPEKTITETARSWWPWKRSAGAPHHRL